LIWTTFFAVHIYSHHQGFPRPMWPNTDMMVYVVCVVGSTTLYVALLATPSMKLQYRMYRTGDRIVEDSKGECVSLSNEWGLGQKFLTRIWFYFCSKNACNELSDFQVFIFLQIFQRRFASK